jgi:hypothetical protein
VIYGNFEAKEASAGQHLFLDRHPAGAAADGTARLMRTPGAVRLRPDADR